MKMQHWKRSLLKQSYSKKNNLKFFGIPESMGEDTRVLMEKLAKVLDVMGLQLSAFLIDNIHRLLANG